LRVILASRGGADPRSTLTALGDIDRDGCADLALGLVETTGPSAGRGSVDILSGKTGALLLRLYDFGQADGFGGGLQVVPDQDNDGVDDLWVSAAGGGYLALVSLKQGKVLRRMYLPKQVQGRLDGFAALDDLDQDGIPELLCGADPTTVGAALLGRAVVLSGKDGSQLRVHYGSGQADGFGEVVTALGDVDADGLRDYAVSAPYGPVRDYLAMGIVHVYSGRDGTPLDYRTVSGEAGGWGGKAVCDVGDWDGDGHDDWAMAAPGDAGGLGRVGVIAGGPRGAFRCDRFALSRTTGGRATLALELPSHAGRLYWILGSVSGTTPGIAFPGFTLPLNLDPFLLWSTTAPNPWLSASLGLLDGGGKTSIRFDLPAVGPGSSVSLAWAALILDLQRPVPFIDASPAVTIWLGPGR
ncbi:MAG: integrin alpha, partial [Planctomycetota bacterium]